MNMLADYQLADYKQELQTVIMLLYSLEFSPSISVHLRVLKYTII